jgi:serine/threonine-protein kinase
MINYTNGKEKLNYRLIIVIITLITIVFLFIIINWVISGLIHQRKEVMVPSLIGKSVVDALDILSKYNLGIKKDGQEYHSELPVGTITRQNPLPGMMVREGKMIKVTISQGGEMVFVPDITGETIRNAELIIHKNQLNIGNKIEMYSLQYEKNKIISQEPPPNSIVNKNTPINITVSLGPPPEGILLIPNFIGKNILELKTWCEQNKTYYSIVEEKLPGIPGTIIQQFPVADTVITGTETINATIISQEQVNSQDKNKHLPNNIPIHYEVPQGISEQIVRMIIIDENGEREIYSKKHLPGTKIDLSVFKKGHTKLRIFINNILVEERIL